MDLDLAQKLLAAQSAGLVLSASESAMAREAVVKHAIVEMRKAYSERGKALAAEIADAYERRDPAGYIGMLGDQVRGLANTLGEFERRAAAYKLADDPRATDVGQSAPVAQA